MHLPKHEVERIKRLEKEYNIKLVELSYIGGVPCYTYKGSKGNKIVEILNQMEGGEKEKDGSN